MLINLPYVVSAESALKELKKEAELIAMGKALPKEPLRAAVDFVKYLITQETGRN